MNSMVIYDSNYGNTKRVADAIAESLNGKSVCVKDVSAGTLDNVELLIVGSPINAWRATEKVRNFLETIPENGLSGVYAAAFDTRIKIFISGNAAKKISRSLLAKGASIVAKPEGFYVIDNEGPLAEGEVERAKAWGNEIVLNFKKQSHGEFNRTR